MVTNYCEVIIYTAAKQEYADEILNILDKDNKITKRLYRQHCNPDFSKDASLHCDKSSEIIIIDDIPDFHRSFKENIIGISPWKGQVKDNSLLKLSKAFEFYYSQGNLAGVVQHCQWNKF